MDDLVRAGKVLYLGISDTPAWQVSRMQAVADLRGWSPLVALQIEYSLIERTVERELIPMAREMGLGVLPWSPLGSGVLTGKYTRADLDAGDGVPEPTGTRKNVAAAAGSLTERSLAIAEVVGEVAEETGHSRAQVALAWTLSCASTANPTSPVCSPVMRKSEPGTAAPHKPFSWPANASGSSGLTPPALT